MMRVSFLSGESAAHRLVAVDFERRRYVIVCERGRFEAPMDSEEITCPYCGAKLRVAMVCDPLSSSGTYVIMEWRG